MISPPAYKPLRAMNDRLSDLIGSSSTASAAISSAAAGSSSSATAAGPVIMQDFFAEVQEIKQSMELMRNNVRLMEESHSENLTAMSTDQSRRWSNQLEELTQATNRIVAQVRDRLKELDEANKEHAARYKSTTEGATESRIRTNMHGSLTRKFVELMADYQDLQTRYKTKYRERMERQYRIINPTATKEEVQVVVENPQADLFSQQIAGQTAVRNALADIQDRHKDLLRLETSINELHQLFLDVSVLVEAQGELLNQIEHAVGNSVINTGGALEELRRANHYKRRKREFDCWVASVILIIIVILGMPVLVGVIDDDER